MLVSRTIVSKLLKYERRLILSFTRCSTSNSSHISSLSEIKTTNNSNSNNQKQELTSKIQSIHDNNDWLWAYLRNRKNFIDLNQQQRQKVIEIG